MSLRAGIDTGDIYVDALDIQGRVVNMAARLIIARRSEFSGANS